MVWSAGSRHKRRRRVDAVRNYAMLPGPQRLWSGGWFRWPDIQISNDDIGRWPSSTGALVKLAAFLSSLHWPDEVIVGSIDLGGEGGGGFGVASTRSELWLREIQDLLLSS